MPASLGGIAYAARLPLLAATEHPALVNPSYCATRLDDAKLNIVITDLFTGYPPGEGAGYAVTVFRMNGLGPETRIPVKLCDRQAPDAFKAWAHIQDLFRLQGRNPYHFRECVGHAAKAFLALPQGLLGAFALNRNQGNVHRPLNQLNITVARAARFAKVHCEGTENFLVL